MDISRHQSILFSSPYLLSLKKTSFFPNNAATATSSWRGVAAEIISTLPWKGALLDVSPYSASARAGGPRATGHKSPYIRQLKNWLGRRIEKSKTVSGIPLDDEDEAEEDGEDNDEGERGVSMMSILSGDATVEIELTPRKKRRTPTIRSQPTLATFRSRGRHL